MRHHGTRPRRRLITATTLAAVIGGPVMKDKAFFFFSYAGLRQVVGQFLSGGVVPTANERQGDFTADSFKVYLPGTKTQVQGTNSSPNCQVATLNCVPANLLDKTAASMLSGTNKKRIHSNPQCAGQCLDGLLYRADRRQRISGQIRSGTRQSRPRVSNVFLYQDHAKCLRQRQLSLGRESVLHQPDER